jgi:hypothetical protein
MLCFAGTAAPSRIARKVGMAHISSASRPWGVYAPGGAESSGEPPLGGVSSVGVTLPL